MAEKRTSGPSLLVPRSKNGTNICKGSIPRNTFQSTREKNVRIALGGEIARSFGFRNSVPQPTTFKGDAVIEEVSAGIKRRGHPCKPTQVKK